MLTGAVRRLLVVLDAAERSMSTASSRGPLLTGITIASCQIHALILQPFSTSSRTSRRNRFGDCAANVRRITKKQIDASYSRPRLNRFPYMVSETTPNGPPMCRSWESGADNVLGSGHHARRRASDLRKVRAQALSARPMGYRIPRSRLLLGSSVSSNQRPTQIHLVNQSAKCASTQAPPEATGSTLSEELALFSAIERPKQYM
jgi:hypothetical protein